MPATDGTAGVRARAKAPVLLREDRPAGIPNRPGRRSDDHYSGPSSN